MQQKHNGLPENTPALCQLKDVYEIEVITIPSHITDQLSALFSVLMMLKEVLLFNCLLETLCFLLVVVFHSRPIY
jgi:hypothetical protein